jgi:hypothetical protein
MQAHPSIRYRRKHVALEWPRKLSQRHFCICVPLVAGTDELEAVIECITLATARQSLVSILTSTLDALELLQDVHNLFEVGIRVDPAQSPALHQHPEYPFSERE